MLWSPWSIFTCFLTRASSVVDCRHKTTDGERVPNSCYWMASLCDLIDNNYDRTQLFNLLIMILYFFYCYLFRVTCYIDQMGAWYDVRTKQEVMNLLVLRQLKQSVGTFGLTGLDKLLSFMIVKELQVCTSCTLFRVAYKTFLFSLLEFF